MKKILVCLVCMMLFACTPKPKEETTTLRVLAPKGAPALALANASVNQEAEITFVDGTDLLTTEFAKESGDYDLVVAPINLGGKLIQDGKTNYVLAGVVTWGNLYLVANKQLEETDIVTAFGQGAVPDKVMLEVFKALGINNNIDYFPSVTEVQAQMLTNKADIALIAEPAATATIAKAKQSERELTIVMDFQKEWKNISGNEGYPQAALFVRSDRYETYKTQMDAFLTSLAKNSTDSKADPETLRAAIESIGAENLGLPNADMAIQTYPRLNINFVPAQDVKEDIRTFLAIFNITLEDSFLLP